MHTFTFTVNFSNWTDAQIHQLIEVFDQAGEYDKRDVLIDYLHPPREEIITVVDQDGTTRTYTQLVSG